MPDKVIIMRGLLIQHNGFLVLFCCKHYREKIITRLPAGNVRHAIPESRVGMYRCSVELSVQYDGQSQTESEHASLIDEHDSFNSVAKQIRFVF